MTRPAWHRCTSRPPAFGRCRVRLGSDLNRQPEGSSVKSVKYAAVASVLAVALALVVSACGGSSTTTTVTEQAQPTQTAVPTTTTAPKPTTTSSTATSTTTGSTTTTAGPSSCGPNQAFSQVSHTCVNTNPSGNPCPKGQVPMADRPVC